MFRMIAKKKKDKQKAKILSAAANQMLTEILKTAFKAGALSQMRAQVYIGKPMSGIYLAKETLTDEQIWKLIKKDFLDFIDGTHFNG